VHVCVCVCLCTCVRVCVHMCVSVHMCEGVYAHACTCVHCAATSSRHTTPLLILILLTMPLQSFLSYVNTLIVNTKSNSSSYIINILVVATFFN